MKKIIVGVLAAGLMLATVAKVEAGRKSEELEGGMQEIDASFAQSQIVSNGYPCRRVTRLSLKYAGVYMVQCDNKHFYDVVSSGSRWTVSER